MSIAVIRARATIDRAFPGYDRDLTPAECIELATLIDRNDDEGGLYAHDRDRFDVLADKATRWPRYTGPDERY